MKERQGKKEREGDPDNGNAYRSNNDLSVATMIGHDNDIRVFGNQD